MIDVDAGFFGVGGVDHAGDVAVGDQADAAPVARVAAISSAWRGRSRMQRGDFVRRLHALGLGQRIDVLGRAKLSRSTTPLRIARADGDLVHVDVGRVEQRAAFGHRHHGDRARHVLGAERGALERIDRDVDFRPLSVPTSSPMNSIGASSRSPSPITTVPLIGSLLSSRRMASTAAWSAAFSSPRPRRRAADTAARSVTRTISMERMRSMKRSG
jgi:hypothetical protein